jgi:peptide/nickel transport system permease protein
MLEETKEIKEEDFKVREKEGVFKHVLKWIATNIPFILLPGSRLEDLSKREFEYEKNRSQRKMIRRFKSVLTILGIIIILFVTTLAVFPHWVSPYTFAQATKIGGGSWEPPSPDHLLGVAFAGRDVLARLVFGARTSLTVAFPSIVLSVVGGSIVGIIAAYYRGWVDSILMRIADIFLAFPGLILALVVVSILGQRLDIIMAVYGVLGIPFYARLIRGNVLQARELQYVQAARVAGAGNGRIMFRHILPNCIQPVLISFTFDIGGVILGLAGLAFLGFGDTTVVEWGYDISLARDHIYTAPWTIFWPGMAILITVLGFMLLGDGLRDALDPRLRNL